MLVTRGLGGIRPSAVVFGLGRYSSVTPPTPTPSGGGGSKGKKPWRVDYLEDYPGYIRPAPAPAVTKPPRRRKSVNLTGPNVTPMELLNSLGVALPEFVPEVEASPAILAQPAQIKIDMELLVAQYRARQAELVRIARIERLKRQNAAAFLLLM
jgi:hypothetical protein